MPRFSELDEWFVCPYRNGCPYLEGLPAKWVWDRYNESSGIECHYEYQLEELNRQLTKSYRKQQELERENQHLKAQLHALHRRQFKARKAPAAPNPDCPSAQRKKRGAPPGHPPWQRPKPTRIDQVISVPAPKRCPHCQATELQPVKETHEHVQEDIVLEPRTVATCYVHQLAYCAQCDRDVMLAGPGELPGCYIGPAAKATAIYLRYELNVPDRKISRFFADFFGLKFVPASAYGFERQAVRRGAPLYEDLRQKIQALPIVYADETSWRHDGQNHWVWYAGDNDLACFHLDAHRSTEAAQGLLGENFSGVLVSDAYAVYARLNPKDWQSCLAHLKRKAQELEQELALLKGKAQDAPARRFCQQVQDLIHRACQTYHDLAAKAWGAKPRRKSERAFRRELDRLCAQPLRYPPAEAFRKRLSGPEQRQMFTFLRHNGVAPTNNQAERSLRPVVIMRKVIHGTRSATGLENHSVLRSLFETARRQGRQPHQFFLDLFTKNTAEAQAALYRKPLTFKTPTPLRC